MKNLLTFFVSFFLCVSFTLAQSSQQLMETPPEAAGFSADRLQRLDDLVNRYVNEAWLPGGVFLIARQGKIVYHKSFGKKDGKTFYQNDDIFRIASMTKAITTVSIMQLYEQGKLGLDDPLHRYIPAFKETQVLASFDESDSSMTTEPVNRPIIIRHLLTHSSGIPYGEAVPGGIQVAYAKNQMVGVGLSHPEWSTEEFIDRLAKLPLVFQPGTRYMYGLNMDVLGRVIEVVSGMSLSEYFQQNIFEPLGMNDTYFYLPQSKHNRLVPVYSYSKQGQIELSTNQLLDYPKLPADHDHFAGGGGLSSTAMDYAKFVQALVNNGSYNGHRLLGRKTIEVMTSDQIIRLNEEGTGFSKRPGETYGLGFALLTEEGRGLNAKSPGTYEWGGYFNTKFFIDPAEDLIFVGMTQIVPFYHGEFWNRFYAVMYGAIVDEELER